jgi:hypothetical protein
MRIGILGSGNVGKALARGLCRAGHDVTIGTRDATRAELSAWASEARVALASTRDAAAAADWVALATAWNGAESTLNEAGERALAGKVLLDATNPTRFTTRLELDVSGEDSGGERVQRWAPSALVVKSFNTVGWELMAQPSVAGGPPTMPLCGNDAAARALIAARAVELGWTPLDVGDLRSARYLEALAMLWIDHSIARKKRTHAWKLLGD